jgi:hypothetical protein
VVLVGGSENGGADARRKNERRSRALHHQPELENRNSKNRNSKLEIWKTKLEIRCRENMIFKLLVENQSQSGKPKTQDLSLKLRTEN